MVLRHVPRTDTIYGYTAALALELSLLLHEPILEKIAYGNLQWLMGLNGGITRGTLKARHIQHGNTRRSALPASLMCGVGNRWAGTWFQTRGVICNGFHTENSSSTTLNRRRKTMVRFR